jgi:hypothetical protein
MDSKPVQDEVTAAWLLEDVKTYREVAKALGVQKGDGPLKRLGRHFATLNDGVTPELEDPLGKLYKKGAWLKANADFLEVKSRYATLGWPIADYTDGYADVIASWTTISTCALDLAAEELDLAFKTPNKWNGLLAKALLGDGSSIYQFLDVLDASPYAKIHDRVRRLAELTHSIANFTLVPNLRHVKIPGKRSFNGDKSERPEEGDKTEEYPFDFLNLYADLLQEKVNKRTADGADKKFHKFLVDYRAAYSLQDWYDVKNGVLEGKPLFLGQSLQNQLPKTVCEADQCLRSMIKRINKRAQRIVDDRLAKQV